MRRNLLLSTPLALLASGVRRPAMDARGQRRVLVCLSAGARLRAACAGGRAPSLAAAARAIRGPGTRSTRSSPHSMRLRRRWSCRTLRPLEEVQRAAVVARQIASDGLPADTLWIVDMRGAASVAFGAALSQAAREPVRLVPTFNNWPATDELIPAEETLAALATMAPRSPEDAGVGARPVFLLDSWRLAYRFDDPGDDTYDNRYILTPSDLPDVETLRAQGIRRVVYLVQSLDDSTIEEDDVHLSFLEWERAGIPIAMVDLDRLEQPIVAERWDQLWIDDGLYVEPRVTLIDDPRFYIRARGGFGGSTRARPPSTWAGGGPGTADTAGTGTAAAGERFSDNVRPSTVPSTSRRALGALFAAVFSLPFALEAMSAGPPPAQRTLDDYRHFRIAAIDLARPHADARRDRRLRAERLRPGPLDRRSSTTGPAYAERLTRIYMDLLRLEPNLNFIVGACAALSPRRPRPRRQADPRLLPREPAARAPGDRRRVLPEPRRDRRRRDDRTRPTSGPRRRSARSSSTVHGAREAVVAVPRLPDARARRSASAEAWTERRSRVQAGGRPGHDADGKPVIEVRVCREEAPTRETGHVYASGRTKAPAKDAKLPGGRMRPAAPRPAVRDAAPRAGARVRLQAGARLRARLRLRRRPRALRAERPEQQRGQRLLLPEPHAARPGHAARRRAAAGAALVPVLVVARGRALPRRPVRERPRLPRDPHRQADVRERAARAVLPDASSAATAAGRRPPSGCSRRASRSSIRRACPADLEPQDVSTWKVVADRGPHAAGILTMPMFLEKYASARARGAVALQRVPLQVVRRRQPAAHAVDRAEPDGAPGLQDLPRDARAARGVLRARRAGELRVPAAGRVPGAHARRASSTRTASSTAAATRSTTPRSPTQRGPRCGARTGRRSTPTRRPPARAATSRGCPSSRSARCSA